MAEDYLTDEEQVEAVKHWFTANGAWLLGGAVLGVALLSGYRYYQNYRDSQAQRASTEFGSMTAALQANDGGRSRDIALGLIKQFPASPYADQARLTLARLAIEQGKPEQAIEPLTQVKDSSKDTDLRAIAALRLARVQIDMGRPDEALRTVSEPAPATGAFAALDREVRGDALYAKHDTDGARNEYVAALGSADKSGIDTALLELKIADLGAPAPAAPAAPASATQKAKP